MIRLVAVLLFATTQLAFGRMAPTLPETNPLNIEPNSYYVQYDLEGSTTFRCVSAHDQLECYKPFFENEVIMRPGESRAGHDSYHSFRINCIDSNPDRSYCQWGILPSPCPSGSSATNCFVGKVCREGKIEHFTEIFEEDEFSAFQKTLRFAREKLPRMNCLFSD